ncbi:MAG: ATP-binding protein, partial [Anaerolineaceae bacterium]
NQKSGGTPGLLEFVTGAATPDWLAYGPFPIIMSSALHYYTFFFLFVSAALLSIDSSLEEAGELAEGDFQAIREPVGGILEIRSLQNTMLEMAGRLETAQENLHSYIGAVTASVESERKSLARELHDDTIQALIALNQRIQLILTRAGESEKSQLLELQGLTQDTIDNLRRMIRGLRPIYLEDLGLAASIEMLAREASHAGSIPIEFSLQGEERRLDPQAEIAIYRIAQESLSNILHHSRASQAWVALAYNGGRFTIQIRDNGQGFNLFENQTDFAEKGHFGLLGMRERAELIGAEFEVVSAPGQGTTILLSMK